MADDKKPDDKKATEAEKKAAEARAAAAAESAPRPDPVGERNYALSQPVVRPEGEGTPGAMRNVAPPVPPVETDEPKPEDVAKTTDAAATPRQTVAPVTPPKPTTTHPKK